MGYRRFPRHLKAKFIFMRTPSQNHHGDTQLMKEAGLSVVIPAYNEAGTIGKKRTLSRIYAKPPLRMIPEQALQFFVSAESC